MNLLLLICSALLLFGSTTGCADIKLLIPHTDKQVEEEHLARGLEYYQAKDMDNALQEFAQALKLNPNNARAHFQSAVIFQKRGQLDMAIQSYERTLALNPQYSKACFNLGLLYADEKIEPEKAIVCFNKFLELNPRFEQAGQIKLRLKQLEDQARMKASQLQTDTEEKSALRELTENLSGTKPPPVPVSLPPKVKPTPAVTDSASLSSLVVCVSAYNNSNKINCSGLLIDTLGHIITANGKSLAASQVITVSRTTGDVVTAKLVQFDQATDLALLKIDVNDLNVPIIAEANNLKPGDKTSLIECFFGIETKIIKGTITAFPVGNQSPLLQTDIALEEAGSGSPLFDETGKLIGIALGNGIAGKVQVVPCAEIKKLLPKPEPNKKTN